MRTVALVSYWCRGRCSCCFSFAALSSSSFSSSSLVLLYEWQSDIAVMYLNKKSMGFLVHAHRRSLRMLAPTPVLLQLERCSSLCVCVCATLSYYDPYMYIQVIELGLSRLEKQRLGLGSEPKRNGMHQKNKSKCHNSCYRKIQEPIFELLFT